MKNDMEIKSIVRECIVNYPPDMDESEIASLGTKVNSILKVPLFLNFSDGEEFHLHFSNYLLEIVPSARAVFLFSYHEEREEYTLNVAGPVEKESVPAPYGDFLPVRGVKYAGKPLHLERGENGSVDEVLVRLGTLSAAIFPITTDNEFRGAVLITAEKEHTFTPLEIKILWNISFNGDLFFRITESSKSLVYYALFDPLTSLFNRRVFNDRIVQEVQKSRRYGTPSSVLVLDIDNFKEYNDKYHHTIGDMALQEVSEILKGSVREVDTVARLGGDEFGIILSGTDSNNLLIASGRILERVAEHTFYDDSYQRNQKMTMSIGGAVYPQDALDGQDLVQKADSALFTAKKLGGNRVIRNEDLLVMKFGTGTVEQDIQAQSLFEAVRTVFNFEKFMMVLLQISMDSVMADRGSFFVKDIEESEYILLAKRGFSINGSEKKKIYGGEIIKRVGREGKPFLYDEMENSEVGQYLTKEGFYNDSFISFPLKINGSVIGVLSFSNKRGGKRFSPEDIERVSPVLDGVTTVLDEGIRFRGSLKAFGEKAISTMARAFEVKYPFYSNHSNEVADLCVMLGKEMGLNPKELEEVRTAGLVHDVGMIAVPSIILNKKETLEDREKHLVRKHPYIGWKMLESIPEMDSVRNIVLYHHERIDGSGYPFGLKGDEIPVQAGILAIAEFFASVTSSRPFRDAMPKEDAISLLKNYSGSHFDGQLVEKFVGVVQ